VPNFIGIRETLQSYDDLTIFQNGGRTPSCIFKKSTLNYGYGSEGQCASSRKILWRLVKPLRWYGYFPICEYAVRPPSWILEIQIILSAPLLGPADWVKWVKVRYSTRFYGHLSNDYW